MKTQKTLLSRMAMMVLAVAMVLSFAACGTKTPAETEAPDTGKHYTFTVVDDKGESTDFALTSEEETVGAALLAEGLIEGEDSQYGLYVKTVNGLTADYDKDGHYWAFYIGEEYASTGVDQTPLEDGGSYAFKYE